MTGPLTYEIPQATGTRLVRLADVPLAQRLAAAEACMREAKDEDELIRLFELVYDPGHTSGRIAA